LNKKELIDSVTASTGETRRSVAGVIDATIDQIQKQVKKGDKVTIPGFGTFSRRARSARTARNPRTGESIKIKASKVPAFKPGAGFKTFVSGTKK
jgi:DNA-binding protein HU-beta